MNHHLDIPTSPSEKIQVLKKARRLLEDGYTPSNWYAVINGAEYFCLYGALQASMGVNHEEELEEFFLDMIDQGDTGMDLEELKDSYLECPTDAGYEPSQYDKVISKCSLTSTMYEASGLDDRTVNDAISMSDEEFRRKYPYHHGRHLNKDDRIMHFKVRALQRLNDEGNQDKVLAVIDAAIKAYEEQMTSYG